MPDSVSRALIKTKHCSLVALKSLWADENIQVAWKRRNEFQIDDCVS